MTEKPDRWVAVGLEHQVRPASSNPAMVDGHALAVWRAEDGPVNVWEDRCPHRGMRLSYGFVRGDTLRCIYHGWGYASGGQCVSIPAHPELTPPKTICANVYASRIRYGIVWTNLAEKSESQLPESGPEDGWSPVRSLFVNRSREVVVEGLRLFGRDGGRTVEVSEGISRIRDAQGVSLMLAIQPVNCEKTGLHVVARGEGVSSSGVRLGLVERLERLRGALEGR